MYRTLLLLQQQTILISYREKKAVFQHRILSQPSSSKGKSAAFPL